MSADPQAAAPTTAEAVVPRNGAEPVEDLAGPEDVAESDVLVEDVSIDGMCGVY